MKKKRNVAASKVRKGEGRRDWKNKEMVGPLAKGARK
jgi:hypothetical protein